MRTSGYDIVVLPGDGTGPEVIAQGRRVLDALALATLDPPTLCRTLALSPSVVYRAIERLAAQGLAMPAGHAPRRRRGGLRAVRWRLGPRAFARVPAPRCQL